RDARLADRTPPLDRDREGRVGREGATRARGGDRLQRAAGELALPGGRRPAVRACEGASTGQVGSERGHDRYGARDLRTIARVITRAWRLRSGVPRACRRDPRGSRT